MEVIIIIIYSNQFPQDSPITANHPAAYGDTQPVDPIAWWRPAARGQNVVIHSFSDQNLETND